MRYLRIIGTWFFYGIGHAAWLVYQKTMALSSDIQGDGPDGPWSQVQ